METELSDISERLRADLGEVEGLASEDIYYLYCLLLLTYANNARINDKFQLHVQNEYCESRKRIDSNVAYLP